MNVTLTLSSTGGKGETFHHDDIVTGDIAQLTTGTTSIFTAVEFANTTTSMNQIEGIELYATTRPLLMFHAIKV